MIRLLIIVKCKYEFIYFGSETDGIEKDFFYDASKGLKKN
jgi:hypothetical protein